MPHHHSPRTTTIRPRARSRTRGDRGLTTLEWLLIVAAVAGLAALAVVLVQNVVDDTAEQISGSNARLTAADVAAAEITEEAKTNNEEAKSKCLRLVITYGDAFNDPDAKIATDKLSASAEGYLWDNADPGTCKIPRT